MLCHQEAVAAVEVLHLALEVVVADLLHPEEGVEAAAVVDLLG